MAIAISFSYITPTIKGTPMSNRDHDRNPNQNPRPDQKPGQMKQGHDKTKDLQQGDTMDPGSRGGHRPGQGKQSDAGH